MDLEDSKDFNFGIIGASVGSIEGMRKCMHFGWTYGLQAGTSEDCACRVGETRLGRLWRATERKRKFEKIDPRQALQSETESAAIPKMHNRLLYPYGYTYVSIVEVRRRIKRRKDRDGTMVGVGEVVQKHEGSRSERTW